MQIRVQRIQENKALEYAAIARVKFGIPLSTYIKTLLAQAADKYSEEEKKRIVSLYESIKK